MTVTTAPNSTIRTLAETTVKIVADHWAKATGAALAAFIGAAATYYFTPKPVVDPAPKIQYVNTIPSGLEARVSELETIAKRIEGKLDDMKPRVKVKKK